MSDKVYVGRKVQSFQRQGAYEPFSRVTMWYDDEHYYTAGDDSGRELTCENPWATQAMVESVLSKIKGYVYRPYEAKGCELDPAAELGDGVTVCGTYSVIGSMRKHYDALGLVDISAPGEQEIDHEYPYKSAQERELKRRVKLGQRYQGVSITRRDGLTIVETDGESEGAKVVLNSQELSFYDGGGGRVLYFDPVSGTYRFMGELNVNDKFVVDKLGNVKLAGNINMSGGTITWGGNGPVRYQFAASMSGPWHETMEANDKYRRDSLDGGTTWGDAYQFVGADGQDGASGSDASVTFNNIKSALQKAAATQKSFITADEAGFPKIYGGEIYGANIYAGVGSSSYAQMKENGFYIYHDGILLPKMSLESIGGQVVQLVLGAGGPGSTSNRDRLYIQKAEGSCQIRYQTPTSGLTCGFQFNSDGTIDPLGQLNATCVFA